MAEVNFSPKLAGSLISILPRAAAKTFENRSSIPPRTATPFRLHARPGICCALKTGRLSSLSPQNKPSVALLRSEEHVTRATNTAAILLWTEHVGLYGYLFRRRVHGYSNSDCNCGWPRQTPKHIHTVLSQTHLRSKKMEVMDCGRRGRDDQVDLATGCCHTILAGKDDG
jgi:hypothetical protein